MDGNALVIGVRGGGGGDAGRVYGAGVNGVIGGHVVRELLLLSAR